MQEVCEKSVQISNGLLVSPSIDNFIGIHRDESVIQAIGKLAIAKHICDGENKSSLCIDTSNIYNDINFKDDRNKHSWIANVFKIMQLNVKKMT